MGYPFVVARSLLQTLGEGTLEELARNLWLVDCQACGRSFGDERPSLVVDDLGPFASATLYHRACRSSEYCTANLQMSAEAHLSYNAVGCLLPVEVEGRREDLPVMMINPSLEQVLLRRDERGAWRPATVEHFRDVGLTGITIDHPVPGAHAAMVAPGVLRLTIGVTGQHWDCPVDAPDGLLGSILGRRGVAAALTTAYYPHLLMATPLEEFARALTSAEVASGWVGLARSKIARQLGS